MRRCNFVRGRWSFRWQPYSSGRAHWTVCEKGSRSHWASEASLTLATDEKTVLVSMRVGMVDARPSFDEAVALVLHNLEAGVRNGSIHVYGRNADADAAPTS